MQRSHHSNALLVEIMLVVLFFCVSCSAILELFVVTRQQSDRAALLDHACFHAQNLHDRLYQSSDPEKILTEDGFTCDGDRWESTDTSGLTTIVTMTSEPTGAGFIRKITIAQYENGNELLSLPCDRYFPQEAIS